MTSTTKTQGRWERLKSLHKDCGNWGIVAYIITRYLLPAVVTGGIVGLVVGLLGGPYWLAFLITVVILW